MKITKTDESIISFRKTIEYSFVVENDKGEKRNYMLRCFSYQDDYETDYEETLFDEKGNETDDEEIIDFIGEDNREKFEDFINELKK